MPLHAQAERLALDLDTLGDAVGCLSDQARVLAQAIDAAVVRRVGLDESVSAKCALQQRARYDLDGVHGVVKRVGMAPLRATLARTQARHVHAQGAAGGDVEQLRATASGKERLFGAEYLADQLKLKAIADLTAEGGVVGSIIAPTFGIDVGAAGNGDAVGDIDIMADDLNVLGDGHLQRQATGGKDGIDEDACDFLVGGECLAQKRFGLFPARCHKDEWTVGGGNVDVRGIGR